MLYLSCVGSELLIRELPSILDGTARARAQPQDDTKATLAPKVRLLLGSFPISTSVDDKKKQSYLVFYCVSVVHFLKIVLQLFDVCICMGCVHCGHQGAWLVAELYFFPLVYYYFYIASS